MPHLAHKIALDPTAAQVDYFRRACGTARLTYNWALAEWDRQYEAGEKPTAAKLKKQWNAKKYELFPWLKGVHRDAHARPFADLGEAFSKFFKKTAARPVFKKKGRCRDSFYVANDKLRVDGKRVLLPLVGWVKMREELRFTGKIMSATVSRQADRWFISINVQMTEAASRRKRTGDGVVGVDVGVKHAAVLSTGQKLEGPKPLSKALRRLKLASRALSRTQKGSSNRKKQAGRLAKIHAKVANIRSDFWHKLTADLCKNHAVIGIEDLCVKGMMRNRHLSRSVIDAGFGAMAPMLAYKAPLFGVTLVKADRFYPSSKTCSACGAVNQQLKLSDRQWRCGCGASHDRDLNAARNLAELALRQAMPEVTPIRYDMVHETGRGGNRSKSQAVAIVAVA